MTVTDASWWGVWWLWMLVWGGTVVSMVVAATITVTHWRRHRTSATRRLLLGAFYLDDDAVMDLFQLHGGKYKAALQSKVKQKITTTRKAEVSAKLSSMSAGGHHGVNNEVIRTWVEEATPISVIGSIIDVLEEADDIVEVNLRKHEVTAHPALASSLATVDDEQFHGVRLSGVGAFVSVRGRFHKTEQTPSSTTFQASYGDLTDPTLGPHVHITCDASGLRGPAVPTGSFPARCLGRVLDWDPQARRLVLHPIAIFF